MNKAIIYGNGMLGKRLNEDLGWEISNHRVKTIEDLVEDINQHEADVVVNCVGMVGTNNVDDCNAKPTETLEKNSLVPLIMAEACRKTGSHLIHYSTGCMFEHTSMLVDEKTKPNFDGLLYSRTKAYSDLSMDWLSQFQPITNIRFRVPVDNRPNPRGLIDKLKKYGKVIDTFQSVTWIPDLVGATKHFADKRLSGTFNVCTEGPIHYPTLMNECRRFEPSLYFDVIPEKDLKLVRTNVAMSAHKLIQSGYRPLRGGQLMIEGVKEYYKNEKGRNN